MLVLAESTTWMQWRQRGRLVAWLGLALRGVVARALKARVCVHSPAEQATRWVYCQGCTHQPTCGYAVVYEPSAPADAALFKGQEDVARPLVLAPAFPAPPLAEPGERLSVRLITVGAAASSQIARIWQTMASVGEDPDLGLGPDRAAYSLVAHDPDAREPMGGPVAVDLPSSPTALAGVLPKLRVALTSPLILRSAAKTSPHHDARDGTRDKPTPAPRQRNQRREVLVPSYLDLMAASLRTLGQLAALYGGGRLDADFAGLRAAAANIVCLEHDFHPFEQHHRSRRGDHDGSVRGVVGSGIYGAVPMALARWLYWGGKVHVGTYRVAGAGGWRLAWSAPGLDWQDIP